MPALSICTEHGAQTQVWVRCGQSRRAQTQVWQFAVCPLETRPKLLQEELEAYDRHQRLLEDNLDSKTAEIIQLRRAALEAAALHLQQVRSNRGLGPLALAEPLPGRLRKPRGSSKHPSYCDTSIRSSCVLRPRQLSQVLRWQSVRASHGELRR